MGTISFLRDKLTNVMSGMGTSIDRRVHGGYNFLPVTPQQAEASYRSSWLMRKIVDLPALDMTRNWRAWQADREQIKVLEAAETALQVQHKFKRALVLSRLWGGGAIVMGVTGAGEPEDELRPERVRQGALRYLHVFSRHQLQTGEVITNPDSPWFGHPSYYSIVAQSHQAVKIHPSRVISLCGQPAPEGSTMQRDLFWGDPIYQSIEDALHSADLAQDGFAALIDEAKVDVIKIPDLMKSIASSEYEQRLMDRLRAAASGKSTWRSLILDGAEEWDQKQIQWGGIPDVLYAYLQIVAGAADIPITRLLGTSPKGLQSTGEGEERDYHAMVMARQNELLAPGMMRLDDVLIRHALGSRPDGIWWKFVSLSQLSPKEAAEIEERRAKTVQTYATTGLMDSEALGRIAENAMIESGQWPGADEAFEDAREASEDDDDLPEDDPEARAELLMPGEDDPTEGLEDGKRKYRRGLMTDVKFDDGKVRSLYVHRQVLNAEEILAHYRAQGLEDLEPADELHITIIYSTTELDWMLISPDWSSDPYQIPAGGPRQMDLYGPLDDYLVLLLNDDHLEWRHEHMIRKGAVSKWPDFQPHITIAHPVPSDMDTDAIEPWKGPVVLGPEIFEEIDPDR